MEKPNIYLKPSMREVFARMTDPRGVVLKMFLGLSLLGCVASGVAFAYAETKWQEALTTIALTFTATALSASFIEASVRIREVWERIGLIRQFSALFGYHNQGGGNVALVLACFRTTNWSATDVSDTQAEQSSYKSEIDWSRYSLKHFASLHSLGTTMADIEVAMDVIASIARVGLPVPSILWDIDAVHEATRTDGKFSTFISIGLCSNVFSVWAANERSNRLVMIDSAEAIKVGSRVDPADAWAEFTENPNGSTKYGLISRFSMGNDKSVMIVGGISAKGSTLMSTFLSDNWQSLVSCEDPHSKEQIGSSDYSIVLELRSRGVEVSDVRVRSGPST